MLGVGRVDVGEEGKDEHGAGEEEQWKLGGGVIQ